MAGFQVFTEGFSENYADVITSRFPDKVRNSLVAALDHKGITSDKIAEKVQVLLDATVPIYKNNNATKQIELVGEKPDYQSIDKGITHAVKIRGDYAPEKSQSVQVQVKGDVKELAKYQALKEKFEAELLSTILNEPS